METRPIQTTSTIYTTTPGAYPSLPSSGPSGGPSGSQPAGDHYARPSQSDQYSRIPQPEAYRPSQPEQQYGRPSQSTHDPSAAYPGQPNYGPPPPGPISTVPVQPPVEKMSGPAAYPTPQSQPSQQATLAEVPRPSAALNPLAPTTTSQDLKSLKTTTQFALREYLSLQRRRGRLEGGTSLELEDQIRNQGRIVLGDLKILRKEVGVIIKDGENHRWRNWLIGGAVATFIPAVKRIFRRPSSDKSESPATNKTEYAFSRSKELLSRIKDSVLGRNSFASIAFFVFAVLYVFSNEVSLQVARTVSKRLKRLSAKIERGDAEVAEQDMKLLEGWRWRVLMWGQ
ncbi:hypothetical protein Cob_v007197 [Colletotrichum orbiculare MAFF 240422]|uniref:Uncharacterized protein n=1 Tax=Colletotrichum orbiculare (strain 104-T / ATCC 96160 / CBS 514.97 / LARS 414 / MAFF 240422) TaxID=1213857 RepID=A0A484FPU4_COLOR|nr:hypothetical protein Cob_v007197 [Colletotrichum orbiculare MAFF 240422]